MTQDNMSALSGLASFAKLEELIALLTLFYKNSYNQLISLYLKMDIQMETVMFLPVRPWAHGTAYPRKMGLRGGLLSERCLHPAFRYARLFS